MALLTESEIAELLDRLPPSRQRFCQEYVIDHNGARAARKAGYAKDTARSEASRLLTNVDVAAYIDHLKSELKIKASVSGEMVVQELMRIAFHNPNDLLNFTNGNPEFKDFSDLGNITRVIKKIKASQNPNQGKILEVETYDKLKALELLGKHTAIFTENVNLTNNGGDMPTPQTIVNVTINHRKKGEKISKHE